VDDGERPVHRRVRRPGLGGRGAHLGLFGVPECDLDLLGAVAGLDVIELGCGTAYLSARLAKLGAHPVGLDLTPAQLATAVRCQERFGLAFPLVEATAEDVPCAAASFDLVVSEYGASVSCDPGRAGCVAGRRTAGPRSRPASAPARPVPCRSVQVPGMPRLAPTYRSATQSATRP